MSVFVLVHGLFQGGWIWKHTAQHLRAQGHTVYAPTLDGCGERRHHVRHGITIATQAEEIADFMCYEDLRDVVLVGTSTGGLVVCKTAELARERINRLVFVDALVPQPGEKVSDIVDSSKASPMVTTELTMGATPDVAKTQAFSDLEGEIREWAVERYTMHPIEAYDAPGELDEFWAQSWAATVIWCRLSTNPPEAHQRRTSEKLGGEWHEMDAGHYPMLSHPVELSNLLQS